MPRPKRPAQEQGNGRLHSIGMGLLGLLAGNAGSDVTIDPAKSSYTDDETNQLLSVPEEQRQEEANSIPTHPTVTANNWLSKGTANRIRSQIGLNEVQLNQGNDAALALRGSTDPMDIALAKAKAAIATNQARQVGNYSTLNQNDMMATDSNVDSTDNASKLPGIQSIVSKLKARDAANVLAGNTATRNDAIAKSGFQDQVDKAGFDAALGVKSSAQNLNDFAKNISNRDTMFAENLLDQKAKRAREGVVVAPEGSNVVNLDTGDLTQIPLSTPGKVMQQRVMNGQPAIRPVGSVSPFGSSALAPAPTTSGVIPKYDDKIIDPKTGKPKYLGSTVNGRWVPAAQ